jgi:SNF2 family DNA or RNA helicase
MNRHELRSIAFHFSTAPARLPKMAEFLRWHLEETFRPKVFFIHGQVPEAQRDRMAERFQSSDGERRRLFALSVKTGGTGLNLTAANHVFHFDRWWDPAVEDPATDRHFRR